MMYQYNAELVRVIDGDTIVFRVDLGFSIYSEHAVRLAGINCPEHGTPEGDAATQFTKDWFTTKGPIFELMTRKGSETEKYGRYLGVVYAPGALSSLNTQLLSAGHAVTMKE